MATRATSDRRDARPGGERVDWVVSLPFIGVHLTCLAAFWTGVSWRAAALCLALYVTRMFGITAGYHRYFAHRAYRTSRVFQFVLAWIGCCAMQKGPLWWAAHHRHHHAHSDQETDVHSPQRGFWWSHMGWFLCSRYDATEFSLIRDLSAYPELVWLNRFHMLPGILAAAVCYLLMGSRALVWGCFISTVALYHGTFVINSLCHMIGRVRYSTADTSRNSLVLALITLGEGWHNNHHHYPAAANMGFFWWEVDISYYTLRLLSRFGMVWDMKTPPPRILHAGERPVTCLSLERR
jgi:stearoyl-CoA desaturase (delta-9 desaturase)